jgi:hypothetical protein
MRIQSSSVAATLVVRVAQFIGIIKLFTDGAFPLEARPAIPTANPC